MRGLRAAGLVKSYRGRTVVRGIDVQVQPGEIVGLLGPNGAGKTTTFRMLAGLERPDAGEIQLDDALLGRLPLWRRVRLGLGYLPQEPSVFRRLSVRENVSVPLETLGRQNAAAEADALLDEAGLTHLAHQRAGRLSGGERRRLELARCLATGPRILLLDEPFSGVDPVAVADLQHRVLALAANGIGVLVTDHAVRETLRICTRAVVMDGGEVMVAGTPAEVAEDPHARARYLGAGFRLEEEDHSRG